MRVLLRIVLSCLCLAAAAWFSAGAATAAPRDVVADYFADGFIDGDYSVPDLHGALRVAQTSHGAQYGVFADAITQRITEVIGGVAPARRDPDAAVAGAPAPGDPPGPGQQRQQEFLPGGGGSDPDLPSPPPARPDGAAPLALLVMASLATLLVAVGAGSAAYRRSRR